MYKDIVGHDLIIGMLKNAIMNELVAHAYLFSGAPLVGKRTITLAFVQSLLCIEPVNGEACGHCVSCRKVINGNHPDIHLIEPSGSSLKLEQVRNIQKEVKLKPYEGRKKVFVLFQADKLTAQAGNSLLKTLEEPPTDTIFLLITDNPYSLLPTILSRCQQISIKKVPTQLIRDFLVKKYQMQAEEAGFLAILADGIVGQAIQLAESSDVMHMRDKAINLVNMAREGNYFDFYQASEELDKNKDEIIKLLDFILSWFRDILIWQETGDENLLVNLDKRELITLEKFYTSKKILELIALTENIKHKILSNVNIKLAMEVLFLSISST